MSSGDVVARCTRNYVFGKFRTGSESGLSTSYERIAIVRKQFIDRYRETEEIYNKNEGYKVLISKIHNAKEIGCQNKRIGYAISQIGKMEGKK